MAELESIELSVPFSLFKWHCHTRAPPLHPAAPCHYISGNRPATRRRRDGRGSKGIQNVVARGEVGGGWALVGARRGTTPKLSGREPRVVGHLPLALVVQPAHDAACKNEPHPCLNEIEMYALSMIRCGWKLRRHDRGRRRYSAATNHRRIYRRFHS